MLEIVRFPVGGPPLSIIPDAKVALASFSSTYQAIPLPPPEGYASANAKSIFANPSTGLSQRTTTIPASPGWTNMALFGQSIVLPQSTND